MDFDEYEYLEKAVEDHKPQNLKDVANGGDGIMKSGEKDRNDSYRQRDEGDYHVGKISKRSRSGDGSGDHDGHREKGRSRSREGVRNEKGGERHRSNREHGDREGEREKRKGRNHEQVRHRDRNRDKVREHEHDSERKEHNRDGEILRDRHERYRHSRSHSNKHRDERESNLEREPRERNQDRECRERCPDREMPEQESRYPRAIFRWSFWQMSQVLGIRLLVLNALRDSWGFLKHLTVGFVYWRLLGVDVMFQYPHCPPLKTVG